MLARIDSTARVTTRQSENAPTASEAATASFSRDEATGPLLPLNPAAPGNRVMACVSFLQRRRITCGGQHPRSVHRRYCGSLTADSPQALRFVNHWPAASRAALSPRPEERAKPASRRAWPTVGPHGSPGDAKHRPETREDALPTMRWCSGTTRWQRCSGCRPPRRPAASPSRRSEDSARPFSTRRESRGRSKARSRRALRHGCSRRARCRRR
jgi:hypothetical protein